MNGELNIWVFLKKRKNEKDKRGVYLRVSIGGERFEISAQAYCLESDWNKAFGRSYANHELNLKIEKIKSSIYEKYFELQIENKDFSLNELKLRLQNKTAAPSILNQIKAHNERMKALIPQMYSLGTLKNYNTLYNHMSNFLDFTDRDDIQLKRVNYLFIKDFESYLLTKTKCQNNGAIKILQNMKKITTECLASGLIEKDPFALIKFNKTKYKRGYLSCSEIKKIESVELPDYLDRIRDLFVFSIYTGLSFVDINSLTIDQINKGNDGKLWINIQRKKSGERCDIPLLSKPEKIMQKYKGKYAERVFKKITNQRVNLYLKQIANLCEIQKRVSFHLARHTFATTITLNNNVPIETVSRVMGHSKISTTQIYAKILEKKIGDDIRSLES